MKIDRVETERCLVGEGPLWDVGEQALYFIDAQGQKVFRYDPCSNKTQNWSTPTHVTALALRESGGAVLALESRLYTLDFTSGAIDALAKPPSSEAHFNDGKVDRQGRFVTGTRTESFDDPQPVGAIYSLGTDHVLAQLDTKIFLSNGPSWSPDNRTLYFSDSVIRSIFAYDYDLDTGAIANKRLFADTRALGGIPDGTTVDSSGRIWAAICQGGKVVAFSPDGSVEHVIEMPVQYPTSVMFGGAELDQLYVTTLGPGVLGAACREEDGYLYRVTGLGVRGLPEPRYRG